MTEKENDILEKAEDVILRKMEHYLEASKEMTDKDIYSLQMLVITLGRIRAIKAGRNYYEVPSL